MKNRILCLILSCIMIISCTSIAWASDTIQTLTFVVDDNGTVNIDAAPKDYVYAYRTSTSGYDTLILSDVYNSKVGDVVIKKSDFQLLDNTANLNGNPFIEIVMIKSTDWNANSEPTVYGYGDYTLPLSQPTLNAYSIALGREVVIHSISTPSAKYEGMFANIIFAGWYLDKEATIPAEEATEAYAVFDISLTGLIGSCDTTNTKLSDGVNTYKAAYVSQESLHRLRCSFLAESTIVAATVSTKNEGGSVEFTDGKKQKTLTANAWGTYENTPYVVTCNPGYYIKNIYINNEKYDEPAISKNKLHILYEDKSYSVTIDYKPSGTTLIEVEFGVCDVVQVDPGYLKCVYENSDIQYDETWWHKSGKYYVAEGYATQLFIGNIYEGKSPNGVQHKDEAWVTTKTALSEEVVEVDHIYYWFPSEQYNNGKSDTITIYPINVCISCAAWTLKSEVKSTCQTNGTKSHYYCKDCEFTADTYKRWILPIKLQLPLSDHSYTTYTTHTEKQHTIQCAHCSETITENHSFNDNKCVCGATTYLKGDLNGDKKVTDADAIHLLYYTIFGDDYPINQSVDFNGDKKVTDADAVHLLYHTIFGDDYPLK